MEPVNKISDLQVGDPWDESTQIGPVLNERRFNRIMTYIEDGQVDGAEILCGGKPSAKPKGNHRADSHQEGKSLLGRPDDSSGRFSYSLPLRTYSFQLQAEVRFL
ncbi:aldehyde dehydrogenase family protein [Rhizobium leguminosarum]|uniref:aldehyde dehydrogenase family protein n=1 Tax=Rhizobium leguminosarum TaxID=384 RepID=UPI001C937B3C|nr:aldehyde dehydrogenase family protein [Rhizobium leguminosarum]MBY5814528.1 aldehyde dehydrogenase family protein [Rhizobium leguminosarum]